MSISRLILLTVLFVSVPSIAGAEPPWETVEDILCRGTSAVGFSYEWGGECWCASGCSPDFVTCSAGSCSGNCPDCSHTGTYGADCSGFVSRAWQVPSALPVNACDTDRYVASNFTSNHDYWDTLSVDSLQPGDAAATSSHVVLIVGDRNADGYDVVEARGCSYGIVHRRRSLSGYVGARRINLESCSCDDGDIETRPCGDCGLQERTCDGCDWSPWSTCEGPDPTGAEADCIVDGALGTCANGRRLCVAGWLTCEPQAATVELCDNLDNDCDGVVDNGTPESLGEGGVCSNDCGAGELRCIDGALHCLSPGSTSPDDPCDDGPVLDAGSSELDEGEYESDDGRPVYDDDSSALDGGPSHNTNVSYPNYRGDAANGLIGGCVCSSTTGPRDTPVAPIFALLVVLSLVRRRR